MRHRTLFRLGIAALLTGLLLGSRPAAAGTTAGHEVRKVGHKVAFGYNKSARDYHYRQARTEKHRGHPTRARMHKKKAFGYHRKAVKHGRRSK
jgi:hypothetical protein